MPDQTAAPAPAATRSATSDRPRLLIEDWLPATAIGVECIREEGNALAKPPTTYLHVWWARRPLTVSRAAVLASLLPADFPRDVFERLLGFGRPGDELVAIREMMNLGVQVEGGFNADRAFKGVLREPDLLRMHEAVERTWGGPPTVIDPMSGGGSIPLESARLGFHTLANEYNPVACSVLEATVDYPFRFGPHLAVRARHWGAIWERRVEERLAPFYPARKLAKIQAYIFARTIPCPDTGFPTPIVPDWHLLKPSSGARFVAVPMVDKVRGKWHTDIRGIGAEAGQVRSAPAPTYDNGKGVSLFTGNQIPSEYIVAKAQAGEMGSALYAVAVKSTRLTFEPPLPEDLAAIDSVERELARQRSSWERDNIIPTERIPLGDKTGEPIVRGIDDWADMFSPRQLLCMGVLVEELRRLRPEIVAAEGSELGEAVVHLLAFSQDKFLNYNSNLASWHAPRAVMRSVFDRHDFSFKSTYAEMAPCSASTGLEWAIGNVLKAYRELTGLTANIRRAPVEISLGSATSLSQISDNSITAIVVDPPYGYNVQYSELADFFYVWLKRTIGYRRPEWFSTYLTEHDEEAVVNISRHREGGGKSAGEARAEANAFYQRMMGEVFAECRRILRDDGVLTIMFTHKKQEAWEALFSAVIAAGFTISATWPVKTESEHSLHQARKNAAQSTVLLVCRKRRPGAGTGTFDLTMRERVREAARAAAARLHAQGLNSVDQLVGAFGPAVSVFSAYDRVRSDIGTDVSVGQAIDVAADAVAEWRIEQIAQRGLDDVEPEGRFALLCWDVLAAQEFRFNEAKLLGHAVGMDIDQLVQAGLVSKTGEKIVLLSAKDRRRERANDALELSGLGPVTGRRGRGRRETLKVHPNDPQFRTALDGCHALALAYSEAGVGAAGIGAARAIAARQRWTADSPVARLMEALVKAAPVALRQDPAEAGRASAGAKYPEFHAWHTLLRPLFNIEPPDWTPKTPAQMSLPVPSATSADEDEGEEGDEE